MSRVCILDYGSGNVASVYNLLHSIVENVVVSNSIEDIKRASHLILPGVGAFASTMQKIKQQLPLPELTHRVLIEKTPILGICVGMQVFATKGLEFGEHLGLNWIKGQVRAFKDCDLPLPHIGWNDISSNTSHPILSGLEKHRDFYFVHKYIFCPEQPDIVIAQTDYGEKFTSIIQKDNIIGVQFHPEKSQQAGQKLLLNFIKHYEKK